MDLLRWSNSNYVSHHVPGGRAYVATVLCVLFIRVSPLLAVSWNVVVPGDPTDQFVHIDVANFREPLVGWAAGPKGGGKTLLLTTLDGGDTWTTELTDFPYYVAYFGSPQEGWTFHPDKSTDIEKDIEFYYTNDGGWNWQTLHGRITDIKTRGDLETTEPFWLRTLDAVCFLDKQNGWLVGHTNAPRGKTVERVAGNLILRTADGGKTWSGLIDTYPTQFAGQVDPFGEAKNRPIDIEFASQLVGLILCQGTLYYRTADGGVTWERIEKPLDMRQIKFINAQEGQGRNLRTQDAGLTWTRREPNDSDFFTEVSVFTTSEEGWVAGRGNYSDPARREARIYHTKDGGRSWELEWASDSNPNLRMTYIGYELPTRTVWAGGISGILLRRGSVANEVAPQGKTSVTWGTLKQARE